MNRQRTVNSVLTVCLSQGDNRRGKPVAMFDDLKKGLTEVDAFLAGKHTGYKVTVPEEIDVKNIRGDCT